MSQQVALSLCSSLCSRRVAGTSDAVGYSDCGHVCDDEEPHHEDLDAGDHVHEDHDEHLFSIGVLRIVWSCFPFSTVQLVCIQGDSWVFFWCRCLLLGRVARPCIGLCGKPVRQKKRRKSNFHLLYCQILQCRTARILVRACALATARPRGSAPRSFRNFVSLRNASSLLLSGVFVILQSFHVVDPFHYFSMQNCECQEHAS